MYESYYLVYIVHTAMHVYVRDKQKILYIYIRLTVYKDTNIYNIVLALFKHFYLY